MAVETLDKKELFDFLRPEQVDKISKSAELVKFKAGDTVYSRGAKADWFYIVVKGRVSLRLPGNKGVNLLISELTGGAMFGSCVSYSVGAYALESQCTEDTQLLKIRAEVLRKLMDDEPQLGYAIQSKISEIYFNRYLETMRKLQAIVQNIEIA